MTDQLIPHGALIVIATGEEAKFFRNEGKQGTIKLKAERTMTPGDMADEGPSGKMPPDHSDQENNEATFSKILSNHLYKEAHAGKFDKLVLVADPDTLGEMRPQLHQEVTDKIIMELSKTLINSPTDDIEKSLRKG
uniref:host attachment family protein n=1 Tax=Pararhizobium sp. IMCC3301 TaxID=3067904 RepID=UPI002741F203|nr:host attachment family protein [Pararhizobium sp. IMCC3301]